MDDKEQKRHDTYYIIDKQLEIIQKHMEIDREKNSKVIEELQKIKKRITWFLALVTFLIFLYLYGGK